jgi:IS5 family transposase
MSLLVRTIGLARAQVEVGIANLAYNFTPFAWIRTRTASA